MICCDFRCVFDYLFIIIIYLPFLTSTKWIMRVIVSCGTNCCHSYMCSKACFFRIRAKRGGSGEGRSRRTRDAINSGSHEPPFLCLLQAINWTQGCKSNSSQLCVCVHVCVCVWERECVCVFIYVYVSSVFLLILCFFFSCLLLIFSILNKCPEHSWSLM